MCACEASFIRGCVIMVYLGLINKEDQLVNIYHIFNIFNILYISVGNYSQTPTFNFFIYFFFFYIIFFLCVIMI